MTKTERLLLKDILEEMRIKQHEHITTLHELRGSNKADAIIDAVFINHKLIQLLNILEEISNKDIK